ncbi:hypothetical protein [Thermomonospora cellulosilytica]|uniref:Uncharacterized protein n=1 Tax=Thermomonospora cellulosilytica TaxID=1411118 RepID=A0A7W3R8H1_9ACTN|nr:hypothetical protein [Thermomonospora cellulosilytica]MBA9003721.1 hypothetical protein [Thermomonospora cellulosilytica]
MIGVLQALAVLVAVIATAGAIIVIDAAWDEAERRWRVRRERLTDEAIRQTIEEWRRAA